MRRAFELREHWCDVSIAEFEAFLRDYPRPLEARPPLHRKANYREWLDPALGAWPDSAVAKSVGPEKSPNPRGYKMLEELNVRPRTSYLGRVRNPNPELG